jgi:glycerol-3-phosphate dehydrogenase
MEPLATARSRPEDVDRLGESEFDVLVMGGGIVGAGVARDAAMRGLSVALVEQSDFASGTSGRTSRLLHGGIRYLAQGHVGLVRQASREKAILHRIAPHLVEPLPFVFPIWPGSPWPLWQLRIGVKLYDLLAGKNLGASCHLRPAQVIDKFAGLRSEKLRGAVRYFDALTNDSRLTIDTLASAAAAGAAVCNYVRLEQSEPTSTGWRCTLTDTLADRAVEVRCRSVVHAAGPWAGRQKPSSLRLRLTKGVHLVVDRDRFPVAEAIVMSQADRIMFAIPWGERVILGTTDTDYEGDPAAVATEAQDVAEILEVANTAFPRAELTSDDVVSTWAGLRPLIDTGKGGPSDISRSHSIEESMPDWYDVAGGKLTTYRLMAEQVVDRVARSLRKKCRPCQTAEVPLLESSGLAVGAGILPPEPSEETVRAMCADRWAIRLEDCMIRRGGWHYYQRDTAELAEKVADWMAAALGWTAQTRAAELARYRQADPGWR